MNSEVPEVPAIALAFVGVMLLYLIAETLWLLVNKKAPFRHDFLQPVKNAGFMALLVPAAGKLVPVASAVVYAWFASAYAPFQFAMEWWVWPLGLLIYEFWYWVQHYLAHKVRLFWCWHSPHHAPPTINMLVGTNHNFVETLFYFPIFLGALPALCGVPVEVIIVINIVDSVWGSLLHVSTQVVAKGRYGFLERFLQTPSYHRAHHARNVRYMDTNFNSITLFWDYVFKTRQPLLDEEQVDYGITRPMNTESFREVQFGEYSALWQDVKRAPGWRNKLGYLFHAPGWSHDGDHHTVALQKKEWQLSEKNS